MENSPRTWREDIFWFRDTYHTIFGTDVLILREDPSPSSMFSLLRSIMSLAALVVHFEETGSVFRVKRAV